MGPPAKKRGRKPAQKVVRENRQDDTEEDEAEYLMKLELIELIQGYPEIYDIACEAHKKEFMRNKAWEEISTALFLPGK